MGASVACLKIVLLVFNVIIWLLGVAITTVGIWIRVDPDFWTFQQFIDLKDYYSAVYIVIAVGLIIFIIGFFGCCGAATENTLMLMAYFVIVLLVVIVELAAIGFVWAWVNNDKLNDEFTERIKDIMAKKDLNNHHQVMSLLEAKLQCCGAKGPSDYGKSVPPSCKDDEKDVYEKGCVEKLRQTVKDKADIIGGVIAAILVLQIVDLVITMCLYCTVRQPIKLFM